MKTIINKDFDRSEHQEFWFTKIGSKWFKFCFSPRINTPDGRTFPAEYTILDKEKGEEWLLLTNNYDDNLETGIKHFEDPETAEKFFQANLKIIKKLEGAK